MTESSVLLIYPPVSKPSEPPAGIAKLQGFLKEAGLRVKILDLNLEGLLYLLNTEEADFSHTWTKRAFKNRFRNIELLKSSYGYENFDRYKRAVGDLNRLLKKIGEKYGLFLSLADYEDKKFLPVRSYDLIRAFERHEEDIFYPFYSNRLTELIEGENLHLIGFSLNYLSQANSVFSMSGFIKRKFPHIKIILGGGLVTSWMRKPEWKNPFKGMFDYMADGPGEAKIAEISGVNYLPENYLPDYSGLPLKDYFSPGLILPYSASSGCYWNKCAFCPEKAEGNPYIPLSPGKVIDDINILIKELNPLLIHFLDNALSPKLLKALAEYDISVPWYGFARFIEDLAELEFCKKLKKTGCKMLKLGLESGSPDVLCNMKKGIDLKLAGRVLDNLRKAGIGTYVYLLFGTPSEDLKEAEKTLLFTAEYGDKIDFLNVAIFNMPVYSKDSKIVATREFYKGDLSLYTDFIHPKGWDRAKVRKFLDGTFKKHPAIAPIIKRNPPAFTSNHASFFLKRKNF